MELAQGLSSACATARSEIVKAQLHQKKQYDRKAKRVDYSEGNRVIVFMPQATNTKSRKLALSYHGQYRVLEVQSNCLLVHPVDKPDDKPLLVSMDHVVKCSPELPEVSWLGKEKGQ